MPVDDARHLTVARLPGGRQIFACVGTSTMHRCDLPSAELLPPPAWVGKWADVLATHTDRHGTPSAYLGFFGGNNDGGDRVERWRLDTGEKVNVNLPVTLQAVFGERGTWMVLSEPDGSLAVRPAPQPALP